MSLFKKIALLFSVSLVLMIAIAYRMEQLNDEKMAAILTQKYLQDAKKLFVLLATSDLENIDASLKSMQLQRLNVDLPGNTLVVMEQPHSFGALRILKSAQYGYLLDIRYMGASLLLHEQTLQKSTKEQWLSNALIGLDIIMLFIIFAIILAMLSPLRRIAETMRSFTAGAYDKRIEVKSRDEIGTLAATYNEMAAHLQRLITSRTELLRDVGHELRTPIARGMFILETIPASAELEKLKACFLQLDRLSAELLQIEKLEVSDALSLTCSDAETLILNALNKEMANEEDVSIDIKKNFTFEGDEEYLALALKNLIDNALKYATHHPIKMTASHMRICVENEGKALNTDLHHALQPFTRQENTRDIPGFGLGLSIVDRVIRRHGFKLEYHYEEGKHRFCIHFESTKLTD